MDPRALPPRLVIDPSLPPDVQARLRSSPHLLRMARSGRRMEPSRKPALLVFPSLMMVLWLMTGAHGLFVLGFVFGLVGLVRLMVSGSQDRAARRRLELAQRHADRYVLPEDLDYPCQVLLRRAQDAAEAILDSAVHRAGLIDTIDNRVTLPEEVWQIAQRLRKLSGMHAEHSKLVPRDLPSGLEDAFRPYSTALDAAWTSMARRVRNLEKYAKQVRKADKVFHAHQRLEALAARTGDYQQLVAETVHDDLARAHIRELADQAVRVRRAFEDSIRQAREAAGELLRPPPS